MGAEKVVKKQLELDFSARQDVCIPTGMAQVGAEIICFKKSKLAIALRSQAATDDANKNLIRSRIDSLLARYK